MARNFDTKSVNFEKNGPKVTVLIQNVPKLLNLYQKGKTMCHGKRP
jgi:hypothetical protein